MSSPERGPFHPTAEWLEADGLGGFASGTVSGVRTRRHHALLLTATTPPAGRMVLVNGFDAWVQTGDGIFPISSQRYQPDVIHPDGVTRLVDFQPEPWPRWTYQMGEALFVEQEVFVPHGASVAVLRWSLSGSGSATLRVRLFLSGRDFHATHHENGALNFSAEVTADRVTWSPYPGVLRVTARSNGQYSSQPDWYRNFTYSEEQSRGLDFVEDLAAPGIFEFDLGAGAAEMVLVAEGHEAVFSKSVDELAHREQVRRAAFPSKLHKDADAYFVRRGTGKTLIAGYPWFGDWERDTFIALRGLCLATGRFEDARDMLVEWSGTVSEGMLPNRFPDQGETPEFNSVDASLWYVVASHEFLQAASSTCTADQIEKIELAVEAILDGYSKGTRFGIRPDECGLLACGVPGVQLTWMDAKVGDWVVTPRIGKPVEVQALWLNALWICARRNPRWQSLFDSGLQYFQSRFWNESRRCLFDVLDCDHQQGALDSSLRPNQIFAVGGLPICLLENETARAVVDAVEASLLTPKGLRTLGPQEPDYRAHYEGGVVQRDASYHQGTVWPWLTGLFVEAWLRVRGNSESAVVEARNRFLPPLYEHLKEAGLGHVSEITDAEALYTPRGLSISSMVSRRAAEAGSKRFGRRQQASKTMSSNTRVLILGGGFGGQRITSFTLIWTAGTSPNPTLDLVACQKERGRVKANEYFEVEGCPGVWALGDCALVPDETTGQFCPPTAQHASRQGKLLAQNIAASVRGGAKKPFRFKTLGLLAAIGDRTGVARILGVNFSGFIAWMLWRGIYWSKLPRIEKKLPVAIDWALDVFFSKDFVQYLHQRAPTVSRSENQPPPPSSAACDQAAATQKQP